MPSMALPRASGPSFSKGRVTTATVRIPRSRDILAMTGAAPVPVPPPMPAVMKSMSMGVPNTTAAIWSCASSAALRPAVELVPAPRPRPICILVGTSQPSSACESVLQTMKLQPWTCCLNM